MVWGAPLLILLVGAGIYFFFLLKGLPILQLKRALRYSFTNDHPPGEGEISHFQALMTTLAATIGVGTVAGVGTAISLGGIGSVFWMSLVGLIGMSTKYVEALLAVRFRVIHEDGSVSGGPMYYLKRGLGFNRLATFFAACGSIAAIGTGNLVQAHACADVVNKAFSVNPWIVGCVLFLMVFFVLIGGIIWIGKVVSFLVPMMALMYLSIASFALFRYIDNFFPAVEQIFQAAFSGQAAFGGFLGGSVFMAIQEGISKGVFSNESGLGSAPIACAAAKCDRPSRQALIAMTGTFFTVIMTTLTGIVIVASGVFGQFDPSGELLSEANLTIRAFSGGSQSIEYLLYLGLFLFAYSTIVGWSYYGEKCIEFIFGKRIIKPYRIIFAILVIPGAANIMR